MALHYSVSAPANYLVDDSGHFVPVDAATYASYKSGGTSSPPPQQTSTTPTTTSPTQVVTMTGPGGATQQVLGADVGYWQSQGWSAQPAGSAPSSPPATTTPATTPSSASGSAFSINDTNNFINAPEYRNAPKGTLFVDQNGTYYYKKDQAGFAKISSPQQLQQLSQQGLVKPNSEIHFTLNPSGSSYQSGGTSSTSTASSATSIPFKTGLSSEQQQGIQKLVAQKPVDQWTATDKANWNYATNNAPLPTGTGSQGTSQGAASGQLSVADERAALEQVGVDTSQLSDEQVGSVYAAQQIFQSKANQDKAVLPPALTATEMQQFFDQAKSELSPYYQEQLRIGEKQMMNSVADITGDVNYQSQQTQMQQENDRRAQAQSMAEQGLTFSGIRQRAQQQLEASQKGLVQSEASKYAQQLRDAALQYEQKYGSASLSSLNIPSLKYAGVNIAAPTPLGGLMGTQAKDEAAAEAQRQSELATQEVQKRYGLAYGVQPSSF